MNLEYHFRIGLFSDAAELIEQFHYSGRTPSNTQCVATWHESGGLFGDQGRAIAACLFSIPPTRWSEDVWELSRLVRRPDVDVQLTGLIAATVRWIARKNFVNLLVSFADATHGHHGGVYQAASWSYDGQRDGNCDGILFDGSFLPGRSCNSRFGTRSPVKLRERYGIDRIEPHYDEGKHLYWRALNKKGRSKAARLGLRELSYPKPDDLRTEVCGHFQVPTDPQDQRVQDLFAEPEQT